MTAQTDQVIFKKLEGIDAKVDTLNVTLSCFIAADIEKVKQHDKVARIVLGNGNIGLRAKMWVLWSTLGVVCLAVIALIVNWVQIHFSHMSY